jgi:hypothetical protein
MDSGSFYIPRLSHNSATSVRHYWITGICLSFSVVLNIYYVLACLWFVEETFIFCLWYSDEQSCIHIRHDKETKLYLYHSMTYISKWCKFVASAHCYRDTWGNLGVYQVVFLHLSDCIIAMCTQVFTYESTAVDPSEWRILGKRGCVPGTSHKIYGQFQRFLWQFWKFHDQSQRFFANGGGGTCWLHPLDPHLLHTQNLLGKYPIEWEQI